VQNFPWRAVLAALGLVLLLVATIVVTGNEKASELEKGLLNFIFFVFAAGLAVYLGRESLSREASEMLRPHGRKAVRRIVALGRGIGTFSTVIETERELIASRSKGESVDIVTVERAFDILESHVGEQLGTVGDAIEDWRDVVPDEVQALERKSMEVERSNGE
jgi:hypothetical protein